MIRMQRAIALIRLAAVAAVFATSPHGDFVVPALLALYAAATAAGAWYSPNGLRWPVASLVVDTCVFAFIAAQQGGASTSTAIFALFVLAHARVVTGRLGAALGCILMLLMLAMTGSWNATFQAFTPHALWSLASTIVLFAAFALAVFPPTMRFASPTLSALGRPTTPNAQADIGEVMRRAVESAADVIGAERAWGQWQDSEEPWVYVLEWSPLGTNQRREPFSAAAKTNPETRIVATWDLSATSILSDARRLERCASLPFDLPADAAKGRGCAFSFALGGISGLVCASIASRPTLDDAVLIAAVASDAEARIDSHLAAARRADEAQREMRRRIANDLHDGPVQSAISAGILASVAASSLESSSPQREPILALADAIAGVSSDLTGLMRELRPDTPSRYLDTHLTSHLLLLAANVKRQWGIDVDVELEATASLPRGLRREVRRIVEEAVNNAAKHARASRIVVRSSISEDSLDLMIRDDGRGFPFRGRFDLAALGSTGVAPRSLVERVNALEGTLVLDSTGEGSTFRIGLPIKGVQQ